MEPIDFDYDIFVSYRRTGGQNAARNIVSEMEKRGIASERIFFDFNSLRDGVFNEQIIEAIHGCKNFILVLSKCSMDRCNVENDWVAREIRSALDSECKIIPVKINNDFTGYPAEFPEDMKKGLSDYQITKLDTDDYYNESMDRIFHRLDLSDRKRTKHLECVEIEPEEELTEEEKLISEYVEQAERYEYGDEDNEPNIEEAVVWYQKAADLGDGNSWWKVGCYYQNFFDDKEHQVMTFECFKKASDLGCAIGKVGLAYCYLHGEGIKKSSHNAIKLFNELADEGYTDGEYYIGKMYADGDGVKKDINKAIQYYQISANKGYAKADVEIGCLYLFGSEVERDWKIAKKHFECAKANGSAVGCFYLGFIYEMGLVQKPDYKKAFENFEIAKENGVDDAEAHYVAVGAHLKKKGMQNEFRMTVDHVFTDAGRGTHVSGTIESGYVELGNVVVIKGNDKEVESVVTGVKSPYFPHKIITIGFVDDYSTLMLRGIKENDVKPGDVITLKA